MSESVPPSDNPQAMSALESLKEGRPDEAIHALQTALQDEPHRLDLIHALAIAHLQLGHAQEALRLTINAETLIEIRGDPFAQHVWPQLLLARAAAYEDLYDPKGAERTFKTLLDLEPRDPRARQGWATILGWGRSDEGLSELDRYLQDDVDEPDFLKGTSDFRSAVSRFINEDIHPQIFLEAHRGAYNEFFNHHAEQMAAQGWIAEAAQMMRNEAGEVVPRIPPGARHYAAVRVDLVNPETGQPGQIGDQPMIVAVADYEALAQAPVLISWPKQDWPFPLYVCSQVPWDQLPVQVRFDSIDVDPVAVLDPVIGDWYADGYDGAFGRPTEGRFHTISDPETIGTDSVLYHVDLGRSEQTAIPDLLRRLSVLHAQYPIRCVLLGRGYLPES